jgi:DNA-3-methyladenine glycosylase
MLLKSSKRSDIYEENANLVVDPMSIQIQSMAAVTLRKSDSWGESLSSEPLPRGFYERNTITVARELLGKILIRRIDGITLAGRIVETEAYCGFRDPASHAFKGKTQRNSVMFSRGGLAYVYFIYGSSYCLNATTEREGKPGAVLIRALEPVRGHRRMIRNRGKDIVHQLTNGPGKLTKALAIDGVFNGEDMVKSKRLFVLGGERPAHVTSSPRIGIRKGREQQWRYFVEGNPFVSKKHTGQSAERKKA